MLEYFFFNKVAGLKSIFLRILNLKNMSEWLLKSVNTRGNKIKQFVKPGQNNTVHQEGIGYVIDLLS